MRSIIFTRGGCPIISKSGSANFQFVIDDSTIPNSATCSIPDLQCKTVESEGEKRQINTYAHYP